ncbi:ABC transporter ATP-binding protein [Aestuariivirga sp. YIM B02566]|uniref:ABC transporter ATP-binding protein n=1 Tax=Taklimakanibacter albus TaxID=2800327 RepID=A0ACC5RB34_9HYPH|nr:ABC transporter ATP-binding protein [Aestuariivirga sp. YIM B02566]MBK1869844.1 ABC transporter ATP-binding protein [Aestuariivirga sp. YIM B02566]
MLKVQDLKAAYGRVSAVKGVSLEVAEKEIVFLIGPNGAGKSTLLKIVSGLHRPSGGTISFAGAEIANQTPETICRRGLVLVPEGRHIFGTLTVAENLFLGTTIRNDRAQIRADIDEVLAIFPILRERYNSAAVYLSGGEQQQLAIARAMLQKPRLMMIDEPSLGLAPLVIDQVYESLRQLNAKGMTLLVIEQSTARVTDLASRVYVMRNGKIVLHETKASLGDGSSLTDAYFGDARHAAEQLAR